MIAIRSSSTVDEEFLEQPEHIPSHNTYTILYTMLEPNVSLDALTAFKRNTLVTFGVIIEQLKNIFPTLTPETAVEFLFAFTSLGIGMYPMMNLTEKQHLAMENVDMVFASEYYKAIFTKSVRLILQGLIKDN